MGSCLDLRKYQDEESVQAAFSKLVSGRSDYKAIIEKRKDIPKCTSCSKLLEGEEKFCPECGTKIQ